MVRKEYAEPIEAPDLSLKSWLRWIWRQLTSMRIALILLLLLAIAAVPGSLYLGSQASTCCSSSL
ncbi:MAG: hypothetical protein EBT76_04695 [Microbacteriaceae bacterium]|nr:hypothetical protein [Microbacteriaceae bacterium]